MIVCWEHDNIIDYIVHSIVYFLKLKVYDGRIIEFDQPNVGLTQFVNTISWVQITLENSRYMDEKYHNIGF